MARALCMFLVAHNRFPFIMEIWSYGNCRTSHDKRASRMMVVALADVRRFKTASCAKWDSTSSFWNFNVSHLKLLSFKSRPIPAPREFENPHNEMAQTFAVIVGIDFSIKEPNRNSDSEMGLGAAFMSNERAWHKTATNGIYPINKAATKEKKRAK